MTSFLPRDIIRKQFYNRMTLEQLTELYEVDEETIQRIVEGITPKERDEKYGFAPLEMTLPKERFIEYLERGKDAPAIARDEGADVTEVEHVAKLYGLEDRLKVHTVREAREGRDESIYELVEQHKTVNEIAEALGLRPGLVRSICRNKGWKTRDPRNIHKGGRQERAKQIETLAKEGYNVAQIAEKLGVNQQTVRNIKIDYGIKTNRKAKEE